MPRTESEEGIGRLPARTFIDGASWVSLVQLIDDFFTRIASLACWVSKTSAANPILDVENEVVTWAWRDSHGHRVQTQRLPSFPGNDITSL